MIEHMLCHLVYDYVLEFFKRISLFILIIIEDNAKISDVWRVIEWYSQNQMKREEKHQKKKEKL